VSEREAPDAVPVATNAAAGASVVPVTAVESRYWAGRRAVGETAAANAILLALGLASGVLAARLLGPHGRGALALGTAVAGMTTVVVGLGLQQAFAYLVAARRETAQMAASLAVWSGLVGGGLAVIVGWAVVPVLVHGSTVETVVRVGLLAVPGTVITTNVAGLFQGLRLGRLFNATRLAQPAAYFAAIVVVALVADTVTPEALVGAYVAAATVGAAAAYKLLSPTLRRVRLPSRSFTASAARYGVIAGIGGAALTVNTYLAVPVLGAFAGLRETGLYAIGLSYAIPVSVVASAIAIHTFPDVAAADREARPSLIRRRLIITAIGVVPLALGAMVAAPILIPAVFGGDFRPAVAAAQVLVGAQAIRGLSYVLADIGRGLGRPGLPSAAEAAGILVTVGLLPVVVPPFGVIGAAVVVGAANAIVAAVLALGVRRAGRIPR
jgi:O-antigen/teichoic acid export membrane protein